MVVYAKDFGLSTDLYDNYAELQNCLDYCKKVDADRLIIEPGVYRFHNQNTITISMDNFEIVAGNVEFRYINTTCFLRIMNSNNITLSGLSIDWCWDEDRLASVVRSCGVSESKDYVDFQAITPINISQPWTTFNELDPKTLSPGVEGGLEFHPEYPNGKDCFDKKEKKDNVYRCYTDLSEIPNGLFSKGKLYIIRHHMYDGCICNIENTKGLLVEDVNVYGGSGMGFLISGHSGDITFHRTKITRRGDNPISLIADGAHTEQSDGNIVFDECEFAYLGDDGVNIHDVIHSGMTIRGKSEIEIRMEITDIKVDLGDKIEFRNSDFSPTGFFANVTGVSKNESYYKILLDAEIPDYITDKSILFNRSYDSGRYKITNCYFHDSRARGVLAQASNGTIENCRFTHLQGAAIQIQAGVGRRWAEGTGVENLTIRNNIIENCDISDWDRGVIYMSTYMPEGIPAKKSNNTSSTIGDSGSYCRTPYVMFKNITIENNMISEFPRRSMIFTSFENVIVKNNKITNLKRRMQENTERGSIYVELGRNFSEVDNLYYTSKGKSDIEVEKGSNMIV